LQKQCSFEQLAESTRLGAGCSHSSLSRESRRYGARKKILQRRIQTPKRPASRVRRARS
jgi:hypothetical protein